MTNREIAEVLAEVAVLMEIKEENPFRCRAYQAAARAIEGLEHDAEDMLDDLSGIRGIGKGMSEGISELVKTGTLKQHEDLKASTPQGLLQMLRISGLGPKRVRAIHEELGVESLEGLEAACLANRLQGLPGFGSKTQASVLAGLQTLKQSRGLHLFVEAMAEAQRICDGLRAHPAVHRLEIAGALRRRKETTKDVDLVASASDAVALMDAFADLPGVASVEAKGETRVSVVLRTGIGADLRVVRGEEFPYAMHHFTGSREHNALIRGRAKGMGIEMNEYGLFRGHRLVRCADEEEIFAALGLSYIPPELREGRDEIEAAGRGELPRLVLPEDIKGALHVHTRYSDGSNSVEEMARGALERGFEYIAVCDHSQTAVYAGGLTPGRLREQTEEIDGLNRRLGGIRILKGIESDILPDGRLDYGDDVLEGLEVVVASVHAGLRMSEEQATERLVRAIRNPHTTILGHPTGRLLLARAECGVAVEFNANPHRLDLDWRFLKAAKERGVRVAINSDAHSVAELDYTRTGVDVARKGWLSKDDVLNAMPLGQILNLL